MSEATEAAGLPGRTAPYVLRSGEGLRNLVAGQVVTTLAGTDETGGLYGIVTCACPRDARPIPMHWHEREHDTWLCTRGKLQVWCGDASRVLLPGDFAYVKPGDTHSYQSVAPHTAFFGVVAPGGWEEFFVDAGQPWASTAFPPPGHPFDFSKMGAAMGRFGIKPVAEPVFARPAEMDDGDRALPGAHASYFLEAGAGTRHVLAGHLATAVMTDSETDGFMTIHVIEAGRGAALPVRRHAETHLFLHLLDGGIDLVLDGATHALRAGDSANVPPGIAYGATVTTGAARWIETSGGGSGSRMWSTAGTATDAAIYPFDAPRADPGELAEALAGIDVAFVAA